MQTLGAAIDEALRDWVSDPANTYYLLGSAVGPHPYPFLVRVLQSVIGSEARAQMLASTRRLPDTVIACVGGGSNAIGTFFPFLKDEVELIGIEAGGRANLQGAHAATLSRGRPGVLHGAYSMLLQDQHGQILPTHSISAGLDYPGVGPEHAFLQDTGRARYEPVSDEEALTALGDLCRLEGILPALESAHALAGARPPRSLPTWFLSSCMPLGAWRQGLGDTRVASQSGRAVSDPRRGSMITQETPIAKLTQNLEFRRSIGLPILAAYLTAGFPEHRQFERDLLAVSQVADLIEIGLPFSAPMADGLVIQRASAHALEAGITIDCIIGMIGRLRAQGHNVPIILMSYLNPILTIGFDTLAQYCVEAGISGLIIPDLPARGVPRRSDCARTPRSRTRPARESSYAT